MDQHTDIGFLSAFFMPGFNENFSGNIFKEFKGFEN